MGMLHTKYKKDGAKVMVERENLEVFIKLGYTLDKMPTDIVIEEPTKVEEEPVEDVPAKEEPVKEVAKEVVKEADVVKKPAKRGRKPKVEKDIVLD